MPDVTRRDFLQGSAALTAGAIVSTTARSGAADEKQASTDFASDWKSTPDRVWLGPDYWTNPLQDWRVNDGRLECVKAAPDRNVHLLTRDLPEKAGDLRMVVDIGRVDGDWGEGKGSAGFRVGVRGPLDDYRNHLIYGAGLDAGLTADGRLFIGNLPKASDTPVATDQKSVRLVLAAKPNAKADTYTVTLTVRDPESDEELGQVQRGDIPARRLVGNLVLVANYPSGRRRGKRSNVPPAGTGKFWFSDWQVEGSKVAAHEDRAFGPILFNQYTLSSGVMKMTAQLPPLGEEVSQAVFLSVKEGKVWRKAGEAKIDPESRTATFRIENWDATKDHDYVLAVDPSLGPAHRAADQPFFGTIRKDPVDKEELTVADISCNGHQAFPNAEYVEGLKKLDPDFLAFVGDQFYESSGGYGVVREPVDTAILDYLRKWYLHGWTWRELTKDRPSVSLPDDHDVYQGNIWGEEGAPQTTTQEAGGYQMDPAWVNVVHRTQTSHHPDPFDATPVKQGITVYYGPLTYGRVSFAVIADRQFKTAPEGVAPPTKDRADHVKDPSFDPKTADVPNAQMLGERQLKFLREWAGDWRGADMKAVISQTIFTNMATHHGRQHMFLVADYDSNGWPQSARNAALREIRKAFAFHIAGDQHLPAVVQYGITEHRDAGVAFAGPATNTTYPRWWEPKKPGANRPEGAPENIGDFIDHFGNPLTVLAVKNGDVKPEGGGVKEFMNQKASGLGIVRFNKPKRTITIECWPYLADPTDAKAQFPGWPVTVSMRDNYARKPAAYLPTFMLPEGSRPILQVSDEAGELVYALRLAESSFQPHVFNEGRYQVAIIDDESNQSKSYDNLTASSANGERIEVEMR